MHEVMNVLLIRFGVMVGAVTLLIIAGFTVAIMLKRRGGIGRDGRAAQAARAAEPLVRAWAGGRPRGGGRVRRDGLGRLAVRGVLEHLDQGRGRPGTGTGERDGRRR
ncbi:hypothetical protein [Actinomadura xylanilytica]|uniref:hypothetical protein n=1 Tax=Actinomadura xylanilytica TaxID=887459 RepID=UPI00255B1128|nr:hypothetical protein [Actinomadura xylanilytica]MDL4774628.1 hypothetical protein [Actinomadura xylanilytica]